MTYLLVGEKSIIKEKLKDIIKKHNITENSISKYDLETDSIINAINDINTCSFFSDLKLVIVNNINKIIKKDEEQEENKDIEKEINYLIEYLNNQNDNILVLSGTSLPNKKKLKEELDKNCIKIDAKEFDIDKYIKDILKDYKMSYFDIQILKSYCSNDIIRIKNELEKLMMYKLKEKEIIKEDIEKLVKQDLDKTIFDLMNSIERNDKKKSFEIYKLLKDNNEEDLKILSMLANNYRLIYQVKILKKNSSDEEIAKKLNIKNQKRITVLKSKGNNFTEKQLQDILKSLANLDLKIKTGKIDKQLALELFIAK